MKKITKDISVLISIFVSLFVLLGVLAGYAMLGSKAMVHGSNSEPAYTSALYFKAPVLYLELGGRSITNFLVVTNQEAVIESSVVGVAVEVDLNPFVIRAVAIGQAQVLVEARMWNGETKTASCRVIVRDSGGSNSGGGLDSGGGLGYGDSEPIYDGILLYEFESAVEIVFRLWVGGGFLTVFELDKEILEGDVNVGVMGNAARISYLSVDTNFKIRFTASVHGEIVAVSEVVQNCL